MVDVVSRLHKGEEAERMGTGMPYDGPKPTLDADNELNQIKLVFQERLEMDVKELDESEFLTFKGLVLSMDAFPPDVLYQGVTEEWDGLHQVMPLLYREFDQTICFGIRLEYVRNKGMVTLATNPYNVRVTLDELINVAQIDHYQARYSYLLLESEKYDEAAHLVKNREERKTFLDELVTDDDAQRTFRALLKLATINRVSDIHIEPVNETESRIRYRSDGALVKSNTKLIGTEGRKLNAVIKIHAGIDSHEVRKPQDGSILFSEEYLKTAPYLKNYSIRVSTMRTTDGEKIVMRLLHSEPREFTLPGLGFPAYVSREVERLITLPHGLILVTGPTGSGKTTTLYSILQERNTEEVNIVTVEDPVEVHMKGVNQTQVDRKFVYDDGKCWDYPYALRTVLRQDPDIILIGEIRDSETADLVMNAALTGHLTFSTLHTNNSVQTVIRLKELGVANTHLLASLKGVISQRLVRRLCGRCSEEYDGRDELHQLLGDEVFHEPVYLHRASGASEGNACQYCEGRGYYGRIVLPELWVPGKEEKAMISTGQLVAFDLENAAVSSGMRPLALVAMDKLLEGVTSLHEVRRAAIGYDEFLRHKDLIVATVRDYSAGKKYE